MKLFQPDLEKLKNKKNIKGLLKVLKRKDESLRLEAINILGEIADNRAVKPLIQTYYNKNESFKVREASIKALGKIGDKSAITPLIVATADVSLEVRGAAKESLIAIGKNSVDELIIKMQRYNYIVLVSLLLLFAYKCYK